MARGAVRSLAALSLNQMGRALQLGHVLAQCQDLVQCLDEIIQRTRDCAPVRPGNFKLLRDDRGLPSGNRQEAVLERKLWELWGPSGKKDCAAFLPGWCQWLQSYQVPLKATHGDADWGKVDLIGVAPDGGPVVVELKKGDAKDSILRVIVESLAYGVVLQKLWQSSDSDTRFRTEWSTAVAERLGVVAIPPQLNPVRLVGVAPKPYWRRTLSKPRDPGAMPKGGWARISEFLEALRRRGFTFAFGSIDDNARVVREVTLPE